MLQLIAILENAEQNKKSATEKYIADVARVTDTLEEMKETFKGITFRYGATTVMFNCVLKDGVLVNVIGVPGLRTMKLTFKAFIWQVRDMEERIEALEKRGEEE